MRVPHPDEGEGVYVLRLERGKYYVGVTNDVRARLKEHRGTAPLDGAKWTSLHKPVQLHAWYPGEGEHFENMMTLGLMSKYGWENVRGGRYCRVAMTQAPDELATICPRCHAQHQYCYAEYDIDGAVL